MKTTRELLTLVCESIQEKKGEDLRVVDISGISSFTDFFVICQGNNQRQNQAICDEIRHRLRNQEKVRPTHIEGYEGGEWILLDYLDFVVHIFSLRARAFYQLEKLWSDGRLLALTPQA